MFTRRSTESAIGFSHDRSRSRDNGPSAAGYHHRSASPARVAIAPWPLATIGAHDGDMRRPYDRKFTCSKCGRRGGQQLWFMTADRDEQAFLYPTLGPAP
jgi:hypothetical protein